MTHLKIEQNNGIIEEVSSAVIDKLYDIVHSGNLDNTSNLIGRLHTTATYQDYIDYLEDTFKVNNVKLLIIDATKKYIRFADPEVLSYWANSAYGDGTGIDSTSANTVLSINREFKNNTSIETFDELGLFINCTTLNYDAFQGCSNLKSIDLSNIISIQGNGFNGCSNLGYTNNGVLNIPKITSLELSAFANCTNLVEVNIGSEVNDANRITSLPGGVFASCSNLEKITGLNKVSSITGRATFNGCTKLESLDFTSDLTNLNNDEIFKNCVSLKCINLTNVTEIGSGCFYGCTKLVDLSTSDPTLINTGAATYTFNWSSVPDNIFYNCKLTNKSFSFPNATSIGNNAFNNCSSLTSVGNLSNCTSIGNNAFRNCTALTTFDFSNITNLGEDAFRDCTSLGTGQTLELNLTNLARHFGSALRNTKFTRMIFHVPNNSIIGDCNNPPLAGYPSTTYLDASDFSLFLDNGNLTRVLSSTGSDDSLVTCIFPSNLNWLTSSNFKTNIGGYRYMIILATTPPDLETSDHNNPPSIWFYNTNLHIYVPDSAKADYLADSKWSLVGGYNGSDTITDRLHGLSELPNGVWTTGLASLYLTPALLATS